MSERCLSPVSYSVPPIISSNTSLDSTLLAATDLSWSTYNHCLPLQQLSVKFITISPMHWLVSWLI